MKITFSKFTFVAIFTLALAFIFSCSEKCDGKKYDPKFQFCYNNSKVKEKCNGKEYNPDIKFCVGNDIMDKCGDSEYDPQTQFCDSRDNKTYKYVKIGNQIWMAENLACEVGDSKCYDNEPENCKRYGRLYSFKEANIACPKGWSLPTQKDWDDLLIFVGTTKKLAAKSGWSKDGNGTDDYGFSILPSGYYDILKGFIEVGSNSILWSASMAGRWDNKIPLFFNMRDGRMETTWSSDLNSVRCIQK